MKRSEMIELLKNVIYEKAERHIFAYNLACKVLDAIEEAGMLPPMLPIPEYAMQAEHAWEPEHPLENYDFDRPVHKVQKAHSKILEDFCQAYLAQTGAKPSEIELVQQIGPDKVVWYFQKRK